MIQLIISARESFITTVPQCCFHFLGIRLGEVRAKQPKRMNEVVVEPRLRILEVDDVLSQLINDPGDVFEVQLSFYTLALVNLPTLEEFSYLAYLLLCLRLHLIIS